MLLIGISMELESEKRKIIASIRTAGNHKIKHLGREVFMWMKNNEAFFWIPRVFLDSSKIYEYNKNDLLTAHVGFIRKFSSNWAR